MVASFEGLNRGQHITFLEREGSLFQPPETPSAKNAGLLPCRVSCSPSCDQIINEQRLGMPRARVAGAGGRDGGFFD
jgi:hypothetical protein